MVRPITCLALAVFLAACTGKDEENPTSTPTDPTHTFDVQNPQIDTGWPDGGDTDTDTDSGDTDTQDTDTDSGGDTDTDTGTTDTGKDTGTTDTGTTDTGTTDTGTTDTGTTDTGTSSCTATLSAEVRDSGGTACIACSSSDTLHMVGIVRNDCSTTITFTSTDDCLVHSWEVTDTFGTSSGVGKSCSGPATSWKLAPGDAVEDEVTWSPLSTGAYSLDVTFGDGSVENTKFTTL